jgi:glycosyltransferase involved in cell wall biosynthesis
VTPLRIAIDARELAGHVTGVGTYLLNLLEHWVVRDDVRIRLFAHKALSDDVGRIPGMDRATVVIRPSSRGGTMWEQIALPRGEEFAAADVLFAPAYTAPLQSRLPTVLVIHDVSFAAHPEWFRQPERTRRRLVTQAAARRAARIITVSDFSAAEIERHLHIPRARITVIPHGAPPRSPGLAIDAREPLVVYVGSIFNRRHVPDLIAAFVLAARDRPDARLLIAGANRTWPLEDIRGLIDRSGLASRITWRENASNAEIADALSRASVSAFLSEYEGFALTPLEGLAHGVPPVLADTPVAREIYGDAALYVAVGDVAGAAAAMGRLLDDPGARAPLVAQAGTLWARYDWARAAGATLHVLREAAR